MSPDRGSGAGINRASLTTTLRDFTLGVLGSLSAAAVLRRYPPGGAALWNRTNYIGRPVTLLEGPAYAVGAVAAALAGGAGAPAVVAGLGAGAFGALDDLAGDSSSKGLRGHLAAAARGEVTTGVLKIAGLGVTGLVTAWLVDRSARGSVQGSSSGAATGTGTGKPTGSGAAPTSVRGLRSGPVPTLAGGAVIAGSANIANLLDLRPGRALKVVLLMAVPLAGVRRHGPRSTVTATATATATAGATAAAAAGAAIGVLADDLAGRSMLGDTGANSAGALLGTALVARTGLRGRLLALAVLSGLTLASERISFTAVIESTPGLRELDALGRAPRVAGAASPTVTP